MYRRVKTGKENILWNKYFCQKLRKHCVFLVFWLIFKDCHKVMGIPLQYLFTMITNDYHRCLISEQREFILLKLQNLVTFTNLKISHGLLKNEYIFHYPYVHGIFMNPTWHQLRLLTFLICQKSLLRMLIRNW